MTVDGASPRARLVAALAGRICEIRRDHPIRIAVDGPDMAGKTTLADELAEAVGDRDRTVIRASVDEFHNPRRVRYRRGRASPDGYYHDAFDLERLEDGLLAPLGPGGDRRYVTAVFDWRADTPASTEIRVAPNDANLIVDGVFLLRSELRRHWDFSIFVSASEHERLSRSKVRDAGMADSSAEIERLFWARYAPAHRQYQALVSPGEIADALVNNDRPLEARITYR